MSGPAADTVNVLPGTAEALSLLGLGDFQIVETVERMAWVVRVLRHVDDDPKVFPHGKWATIQSIEAQVDEAAQAQARGLVST